LFELKSGQAWVDTVCGDHKELFEIWCVVVNIGQKTILTKIKVDSNSTGL
jgi:hypothetical protein